MSDRVRHAEMVSPSDQMLSEVTMWFVFAVKIINPFNLKLIVESELVVVYNVYVVCYYIIP